MKVASGMVVLFSITCGCAPFQSAMPDDPNHFHPPGSNPPAEIASPILAPPQAPKLVAFEPPPARAAESLAPQSPPVIELASQVPATPPPPRDNLVKPVSDTAQPLAQPVAPVDVVNDLGAVKLDPGEEATQIAARVGDTIITVRELKHAIRDRLDGQAKWSDLGREEKNAIGRNVLSSLIDRALILQEARRKIDKPKQWEAFREFFESAWQENELPNLRRRFDAPNDVALRLALEKIGDTLEERHETFLQEQMSRAFTSESLRQKVTTPDDIRPLYSYYRANLSRFHRPAEVTWREIRISADKFPEPTARRVQADAALARLAKGDEFATIARELSDSPRAPNGGLWTTSPGGYASAAVNAALESLPIDQISPLIDDPKALYIIRVEQRREAGPAPFEEVQGKIREVLIAQEFEKALDEFLREIRKRVRVSSPLFDDPNALKNQP